MSGGEVIHALTVNLSPAGIQLACDRVTANSILPISHLALPARPAEVDIRLRFPESSGMPDIIDARCVAIFSRRIAENEYRIGLQFLSFHDGAYGKLELFLDRNYQGVAS
jgi:hypothetical protein